MTRPALSLLMISLVASPALADRGATLGATVGLEQSKTDSGNASELLGLFGRMRLSGKLSGQLELSRITTADQSGIDIRQATGLLILDLGQGALVPIVFAGVGLDEEGTPYTSQMFLRGELGLGLEYRVKNGFTISADMRLGSRTSNQPTEMPLGNPNCCLAYAPSNTLQEGEFRSIRLGLGIAF
jgi:hypothetical protein